MKNIIYSLFFLLFYNNSVYAQKNIIKVDLYGTTIMAFSRLWQPRVSYERVLSKDFSIQLTIEKGKYTYIDGATKIYDITGYGIMPEVKFYPFIQKKQAPLGLFFSLDYRYFYFEEHHYKKPYEFTNHGNAHNLGFNVGFKHGSGFSLEYVAGLGMLFGNWNYLAQKEFVPADELHSLDPQLTLRLEVNVGIGWGYKKEANK